MAVSIAIISVCLPLVALASRRVVEPPTPFALNPLQWGDVQTSGWISDWATSARHGAGSPENAPFAKIKAHDYPPFHIPVDCQLSVDGWKNGRPCSLAFYDEDSAYWIDGMTRLGIVLNDSVLIQRVAEDFNAVIANPDWFNATWTKGNSDGGNEAEGWVRSIYSRALLAYFDFSGDPKIKEFLVKAFSAYSASDSRGGRSLTQIEALVETRAYGGPSGLVDTAITMMETSSASLQFLDTLLSGCFDNKTAVAQGLCLNHEHGVTFNEMAKLFAMISNWNSNSSYRTASVNAYEMAQRFNMQVHGVNSANENLGGISPNIGTETCDISDFMYSNEWMLRVVGESKYGDHIEKAFFNAAPGAVNRSFSGHVYYQSPNMVNTSLGMDIDPAITDPRWAETWYHTPPCCTGNQVRMLPNFIHHMWFATVDGGVAATMHGPSILNTVVHDNVGVTVISKTNYPFEETITFSVSASENSTWPLKLRIPAWCTTATLTVDGVVVSALPNQQGFATISRLWQPHPATVVLTLPMTIKATEKLTFANGNQDIGPHNPKQPWARLPGQNGTQNLPYCVVEYGPLVFALPLEATPGGPFNFALVCDAKQMSVSKQQKDLTSPFDWPLNAPLAITAKAASFEWKDVWSLPPTHVSAQGRTQMPITLIPYGCAKQFHVSMFPILDQS
eukprot:m.53816 g.53816  ORF g.53816 m.53816 type:complete len:675 (-) comp21826_c0_seq1:383-2407(-)